MTRLARVALRGYPPSFRVRYGQELGALVEDLPGSTRMTIDLFLGAARAWIRPPLSSAGSRLRATMATTWVSWCAGFLVAPAVNRALLDPPTAGVSSSVRALLDTAYALFVLGWVLALLGAAPVVLRAVVPALRSRTWTAVRPLLPALLLGLLEALGLLCMALLRGGDTVQATHPSGLFITGAVLWLIGFAAFICSLAIGPAVSLARLQPDAQVLRDPTCLTLPVALILAVLTGCSLAATVLAGHATLAGSAIPVACALAVGCLASLVALISSSRGVHALRST